MLGLLLVWQVGRFPAPLAAQSQTEAQVRSHYEAAREAEKNGNLEKAATEYLAVLKLRPGEPILLNNLGLVYHRQGKYHEAIEILLEAVRRDPSLMGAQLFLGIDYYRTNQMEKAVVHLKKASTINSSDLQARLYLGRSYLALGKLQDALLEFQAAMRIEPKNVDVLYSLGQLYGKLMSETYIKLAETDPESYRVHQVLAESYQAQKETDKAIQEYKAAIAKAPQTPGLRYGLGDVYWRAGMLDEAKREFLEELKINPDDPMSMWKIANVYLSQSRWDDAIPMLEKSVRLQPDLAQAYRDLGKAYFQKNELEKAIVVYNKVVELAPDEDTVHYRLANIYKKLGRKAEAEAEMKIFATLNKKVQATRNPLLPQVIPETQD